MRIPRFVHASRTSAVAVRCGVKPTPIPYNTTKNRGWLSRVKRCEIRVRSVCRSRTAAGRTCGWGLPCVCARVCMFLRAFTHTTRRMGRPPNETVDTALPKTAHVCAIKFRIGCTMQMYEIIRSRRISLCVYSVTTQRCNMLL